MPDHPTPHLQVCSPSAPDADGGSVCQTAPDGALPDKALLRSGQAALREFVLAAPTPRKVGLLLQMQLGLRIGEVCGLQWGDFDFKAGILTVRRTVSRIYCGTGCTKIVVQTPKTKSSGREIPIPRDLASLLRKLRGSASPDTWFLSGNTERPVEPRCYRKSIRGYLRRAGVRRVHPHALRHTFATTCLQSGCDIKTLSEILGHADANVTLKRYVHTDMKRKKTEMQRVFSAVCPCRPDEPPFSRWRVLFLFCSLSLIFLFLSSQASIDLEKIRSHIYAFAYI